MRPFSRHIRQNFQPPMRLENLAGILIGKKIFAFSPNLRKSTSRPLPYMAHYSLVIAVNTQPATQ
jgi:hypothetical protein